MKRYSKALFFKLLGEGILIVASVLVALYLGNWSQEKENRKTEREYVSRIIEELRTDSLDFVIQKENLNTTINTIKCILAIDKETDISKDSLIELYNTVIGVSTIKINSETYDFIKQSGGLSLIQNNDILFEIIKYYSKTVYFDDSNNESMRAYRTNIDLLTNTGHVVADSSNTKELFMHYRGQKLRGLLKLRLLYAKMYMYELERRTEAITILVNKLGLYKKSIG